MRKTFLSTALTILVSSLLSGCGGTLHEDAGKRLISQNDIPGAINEFKQAVASNKGSAALHAELADAYFKNNQYKECEEECTEAIKLEGTNMGAHMTYAQCLLAEKKDNEALSEFNAAALCDIHSAVPLIAAGKILEDRSDLKSAEQKYRDAVAADPDSIDAHQALALVLGKLGKVPEAQTEMKEVDRLKANPPKKENEIGTLPEDDAVGQIYKHIGNEEPYFKLVDAFYSGVERDPILRPLYPEDLGPAKEHLTLFLIQRTGGRTTYSDQRGHPRMRARHLPFKIGTAEKDAWLLNMKAALDTVPEFAPDRELFFEFLENFAAFLVNQPN